MFEHISIPSELWTGWYRPSGTRTWRLVAASSDRGQCQRELDRAPRGGDYLILAPGRHDPNEPQRQSTFHPKPE